MVGRASEKSGGEAASQHRAGYADILARSAWLAWLAFALLVGPLPAKSATAFEKSPIAVSFSPETLAVLRDNTASHYRLDSRVRLEWSRSWVRGGAAKIAGGSGLVSSPAQPDFPQRPAATVEYARCFCDPAPVRFFDAQGPPLRP